MDISIIIPVYRSAATLPLLIERLCRVLNATRMNYELVFIDDGSPDNSWAVLEQLHAEHPDRIVAVRLMRNFGQHNALMCGFRHARGELVVTLDDDLQNPPEEIPKLVRAILAGDLDLVYGRYEMKRHAAWRNAGSWLVGLCYRWIFRAPVGASSFRIIRRDVVRAILSYDLNFTFVDGLLAWHTQRIGAVPVEHAPRREGRTGYSLGKLAVLALNLLTNFTLVPLQVVSAVGFFVAMAGLVAGLFYLARFWRGEIGVPGYASTIVAILVLGGTQLLALGIAGEYLGRMHLNVNRKPQYAERTVIKAATAREDPEDNLTRTAEQR